MRATILDGARFDGGVLATARQIIEDDLGSKGRQVDAYTLREMRIPDCTGCFCCWTKTPGECIVKDKSANIARSVVNSDIVFFLSPVTFGGYSSELKKALDRIIGVVSPFFETINKETHHRARYEKYPGIIAIGAMGREDREEENNFRAIAGRNALNLHSPFSHCEFILEGARREKLKAKIRAMLEKSGATK
ncbi:MAG: NAD(P)H-dependent oxidoreductase [Candidatus Thermoplasmatota archaeon]|nr:NAD(P)H-dependent oxidoreductase [Candidatus Thermoplasmatota archaeon]